MTTSAPQKLVTCAIAIATLAPADPAARDSATHAFAPAAEPASQPGPDAKEADAIGALSLDSSKDFLKLRQKLMQEKAEVDRGLEDLQTARRAVEARIAELKKTKAEVEAARAQAKAEREAAADEKVAHIVKICEKMPPEGAARFLGALDRGVAASVMQRMSVRRAALVLSAMDPVLAAAVSKRYLGNDSDPEKPDAPPAGGKRRPGRNPKAK